MKRYFQSYNEFKSHGGSIKTSTIIPKQLLPALVMHMERMDKQFTIHLNGHIPKSIDQLVQEAFEQSHLQKPFYTQHAEYRSYRYQNTSKNRVKIDFSIRYRMSRTQEKWALELINNQLAKLISSNMSTLEKVITVHNYIVKTFDYEKQTDGSPFAVYTFLKEKKGVCMAYALLFEKMMDLLHIPCYYVIGKANGEDICGHAWNMVKIDEHWYHVDATWNTIRSMHHTKEIRYRYFLLSDDDMKKDHQWQMTDYPPCTSDRYQVFQSLYDGVIANEMFYFSYPKNAHLHSIDLRSETLTLKKCLAQRVQFCNYLDGAIYFSNYSNGGYLTRYKLETGEVTTISAAQVIDIEKTDEGLIVQYKDQTNEFIKAKAVYCPISKVSTLHNIYPNIPKNIVEQIFVKFDSNYFASVNETYITKDSALKISSADGLELLIFDSYHNLTINIQLDKILDIQITSARKNIILETPGILIIPKLLINATTQLTERSPSGEWIAANYKSDHEKLYIKLTKSTQIKFK